MCGIFGIWQMNGQPLDLATVQQTASVLHHRGPDDEGYLLVNTRTGRTVHCGGPATDAALRLPTLSQMAVGAFDLALGFRRLAILDLSPAGHQPMVSPDGRSWLIFNGEIYNYRELRAELRGYGAPSRAAPTLRCCWPPTRRGGRTPSAAATACGPSPCGTGPSGG